MKPADKVAIELMVQRKEITPEYAQELLRDLDKAEVERAVAEAGE